MTNLIEAAAQILSGTGRLFVTTGAGMSQESGIPTFRDAPNALWANYSPEDLATRRGFEADPTLVWNWYADRREMIARAEPHDGHHALVEFEKRVDSFLLATQNIDDLHRQAGTKSLVELHGNIFRFKCFDNDHPARNPFNSQDAPPKCHCGSYLRPDVVWFGEMLDRDDLDRSLSAAERCDTILVVGTSGMVYPAAGFAQQARSKGARVIDINPERSDISLLADVYIPGGAAQALPEILARWDTGKS